MKKFTQMLMVVIVATTGTTYAQYAGDAIRFSNSNYGSSARFKGMGNAQIGVGGDMSSLNGNPAGLGLFTRSEFSLTPEFNNATSKSDYLGQRTNASENKLNINQAGVVWYNPTYKMQGRDKNKGVLSFVFGIGYSRNNDYTESFSYNGTNEANSMRDYFSEVANSTMDDNGVLPENSLERLAYQNYLMNYNAPGFPGHSAEPFIGSNLQSKNQKSSGSTSEVNFSGAMNISNQLYIGASVGMVNVRYINDSEYNEKGTLQTYNGDPNNGPVGLGPQEDYNFSYLTSQETHGSGINLKLGVIFRPVSTFRIGATYQSPTWLYMEDAFAENLTTTLSGEKQPNGIGPLNYNYTYRLKTPAKGSLGASYVLGGTAIISADVDFVDYSTARLSQDGGGMADQNLINDNAEIKEFYSSAVNYRVGGEYKLNNVSLRAGYGLNGSPFKDDDNNTYGTQYYSAGLGFRLSEYYIDLAYQRVQSENRNSPYALNDGTQPVASIKNGNNNVFLTFGVRF
ncbi:OmpP1/FadL family transporter [Pedobacter nyackensis]|uniref:Long-chain fatty acid transport protein n=1 Tax=Pedobacter nyackensis TaxID=475255 RepID=A0A1W2CPN1_9SPHI|nr:outer membrane protein transport protein [Pedobacter nyackensis]SMC87190.1 Long-chain fatty acid transport protein [Pedobacter nyackensis]